MIIFQNPGLLNLTAATTMGVNVKEIDDPIGQFGTGLKYAIAIILRLEGAITIYRGKKAYVFSVKEQTIRGKKFNIVCMNGKALNYTDQLGINWHAWQAYRELYSNARDEGGRVFAADNLDGERQPKGNTTTIVVTGKAMEQAYNERHKIILQTQALHVVPGVEVHAGESEYIYYKTIRVHKLDKKSRYTYNLLEHQYLTEDRTMLYPHMIGRQVLRGIVQATSEPFLYDVLRSEPGGGDDKKFLELNLPFQEVKELTPSPQFMRICEELKIGKNLNPGVNALFNHYADKLGGYQSPYIVELTTVERAVLDEGIRILKETVPWIDTWATTQISVKSTLTHSAKVECTKYGIVLDHKVLGKGPKHVARRLLEGFAIQAGGGVVEQLTHAMLFKAFIPKELTERYSARSADLDMPF